MFTAMAASIAPPELAQFQHTVRLHGGRWYAACLRITRDAALAEDAVQDALLSAWHRRRQYGGEVELQHWIHRIAVNAALQILRRQRGAPLLADAGHAEDAVDGDDPLARQRAQEFGAGLDAALVHLSDLERSSFVLKHVEQWRLDEIAASLGTGVNNIKQALVRAVRKLRLHLDAWRSEP